MLLLLMVLPHMHTPGVQKPCTFKRLACDGPSLQVLRMPTSDVQTVHNAVRDLAAQLNRRTLQVLQQLMPLPEDAAKAQTGQLPAPL